MLKKKWPNIVTGDEGFEISIERSGTVVYREGDKNIAINSEYLVGENEIVIYQDSIIKWRKPYEDSLIGLAKLEEIVENTKRALSFRGITLQVIKSGLCPIVVIDPKTGQH